MSSTQEECSDFRSCSSKKVERNRRSWTTQEEQVLIATMKELIAQGWKLDNEYRAGYLNQVEAALKKEISNYELKAVPHINSRSSSWKKLYNSLSQILSRSGIGFNTNGTFKIDCEDDQWEKILKASARVANTLQKYRLIRRRAAMAAVVHVVVVFALITSSELMWDGGGDGGEWVAVVGHGGQRIQLRFGKKMGEKEKITF